MEEEDHMLRRAQIYWDKGRDMIMVIRTYATYAGLLIVALKWNYITAKFLEHTYQSSSIIN